MAETVRPTVPPALQTCFSKTAPGQICRVGPCVAAGPGCDCRRGLGPGSCLPGARSPEQVGACGERLTSLVWKETGPIGLGGCFLWSVGEGPRLPSVPQMLFERMQLRQVASLVW